MKNMDAVSTTAFGRSLAALERAMEVYERLRTGELHLTVRNSVILEFEICFGQLRPLLDRALIEISDESPSDIQFKTFRELVDLANERGLTSYPIEDWLAFRAMRNRTAHAYSEPLAKSIIESLPNFLAFAKDFANNVQRKQQGGK